jgi:hypothetical protein
MGPYAVIVSAHTIFNVRPIRYVLAEPMRSDHLGPYNITSGPIRYVRNGPIRCKRLGPYNIIFRLIRSVQHGTIRC